MHSSKSTIGHLSTSYEIALSLLTICLAAIVGIAPMLLRGYPIGHSTQFNFSWAFQYQQQFLAGQFYPQWLEYSNFGFGNATFAFYPPLCMVATLPFRLFGSDFVNSLIASMGLAFLVLGTGIYSYGCQFLPRWLSLIISLLAMSSPYFIIDTYQRCAIAEVWAIAIIPWVLLATERVVKTPHNFPSCLSLAIAFGFLGLSHLPTLLIFSLIWWIYPLVIARKKTFRKILQVGIGCYGSVFMGFGGIGFYLLPVLLDQQLVQIDSVNYLSEYLPQNRLVIDGILSLNPHLSEHWFETGSGLIAFWFLGLATVIVGTFSLLSIRSYTSRAIFIITAACLALLMMTDILKSFYILMVTLERIQFSWRWNSILVTLLPVLLGMAIAYVLEIWSKKHLWYKFLAAIGVLILTATIVFHVGLTTYSLTRVGFDASIVDKFRVLSAEKKFPQEPDASQSGIPILSWHWIFPDGLAFVDVPEYRAKGVNMAMPPRQKYDLASWFDQETAVGSIEILEWKYGLRRLKVTNPLAERALDLRTFYYPAWKATIDGQATPVTQNDFGQIQILIPSGEHHVTVTYENTIAGAWGKGISAFTSVVTLVYFLYSKSSSTQEYHLDETTSVGKTD